jgi:hypothetical protein
MSESNSAPTAGQIADPNAGLTPEERYNRVAEAAYLRAAARGFVGGDPMKDWLDAEADLMRSVDDSRAEQVELSQAGNSIQSSNSVQEIDSIQEESLR